MDIYDISASALTSQRLRLDTIASNLANVNTTRKEDGSLGAYKRRNVVFEPLMDKASQQLGSHGARRIFGRELPMLASPKTTIQKDSNGHISIQTGVSFDESATVGVQVMSIQEDVKTPLRKVFDPSHPDAGADGYVEMPNINPITEMVDLISASRTYEANVTAFKAAKDMAQQALEM